MFTKTDDIIGHKENFKKCQKEQTVFSIHSAVKIQIINQVRQQNKTKQVPLPGSFKPLSDTSLGNKKEIQTKIGEF